ncbi:MAG: MerR family transcriptional regulator [Fastidiosipilaceae bacterium]|jgi:DNA-binding transcriptional MerR regulator
MEGRYVTGVVVKVTGLPSHYLRRLEKAGLLAPRLSKGGHRLYTEQDLKILSEVKQLKEKGVNVAGICEILKPKIEEEKNGKS